MSKERDEKIEFARMMAHESRRSTVDHMVAAARVALGNADDENEASFLFASGMLGTTGHGPAAAYKLAIMAGMLAIEVAELRDASSREPAPSPE